jgi:hypothetical protein
MAPPRTTKAHQLRRFVERQISALTASSIVVLS